MIELIQLKICNFGVFEQMDYDQGPNDNPINPLPSFVESNCLGYQVDKKCCPKLDSKSPSWGQPGIVVAIICEPHSEDPISENFEPGFPYCSLHGVISVGITTLESVD